MSDSEVRKPSDRSRAEFLAGSGVTVLWVLTRLLMLKVFTLPNSNYITGDVNYYRWWLTASQLPTEQVLREYPVPVIWGMRLLVWASGGSQASYFLPLFAATMIALDAIMTIALWRGGHRVGTVWWILFVMALGPLMWFRFDMVPAVCMGLAALWYRRHPAACGAAVALGAAIKLWPALLILPMIGRSRAAVRRLTAFGITGAVLAAGSLLASGWTRTVSPLTWQSDRGLQIESVPATVPMIQHASTVPSHYSIALSQFNAYEINGPGVGIWLGVSSILMVIAVASAALIGWITWQRGGHRHRQAIHGAAVIIGAQIVGNKTLSPQYIERRGAPVAVMLDTFAGESARPDRDLARVRMICLGIAGCLFATALLTQCVYPLSYSQIIAGVPARWAVGLLVGRNALAVTTLGLCVWGLAASLRTGHRDASRRVPPISPLEKIGDAPESR